MKKTLAFFVLLLPIFGTAQDSVVAIVEKSVYGIQTGFLGVWVHNESRLSDAFALRSELGLDSGFWVSSFYDEAGFLMAPVITAEPRWYYNLNKRQSKSRNISNNTGNFLSLKTSYHPDWFVISNYDNLRIISDISMVPTWGIRRHIGKHFNYEAGIGVGYQYVFGKQAGFVKDESNVLLNLHLRLGYTF